MRIDTQLMANQISHIETQIATIQDAVNNYSAQAPSLGESTFRPDVENQLAAIKSAYNEILPKLQEMAKAVAEVKDEYITRGKGIQSASSATRSTYTEM